VNQSWVNQSGTGVPPVGRNLQRHSESAITGETPVPLLFRQITHFPAKLAIFPPGCYFPAKSLLSRQIAA